MWTKRVNELRHKFRKISLTSAHVIFLHGAEVNIPIELGAEVNTGCRSQQVGAEVTRAEHRLPRTKSFWFEEFVFKPWNQYSLQRDQLRIIDGARKQAHIKFTTIIKQSLIWKFRFLSRNETFFMLTQYLRSWMTEMGTHYV